MDSPFKSEIDTSDYAGDFFVDLKAARLIPDFKYCDWCSTLYPENVPFEDIKVITSDGSQFAMVCAPCLDERITEADKKIRAFFRGALEEEKKAEQIEAPKKAKRTRIPPLMKVEDDTE